MKKLVEINSNNLAELLDGFVDTGVKVIDEMDLFKEDELFASVPYGKIINYITKKIVQISDPNEALNKAISLSIAYNMLMAIRRNKNIFKIDTHIFKERLKIVKEEVREYKTEVAQFNVDNFFNNSIVQDYSRKIDSVFEEYLSDLQINRIHTHRRDYLKIDFFRILEANYLVYEKLNDVFKNKSHEEHLKLNRRYKYQQGLKSLFTDIVLNDQEGMTLADIYIEPYFKVHEYCLAPKSVDYTDNYRRYSFRKLSNNSIHNFIYDSIGNKLLQTPFLNENPNLYFILGYPGQGKSSFCKKMIFDIYSDTTSIEKNIVFIKIRNITDTLSLINNPLQTLYEHWLIEYEIDKNDISMKEFQESLLIIDGLDELFMKENLPQKAIDEFCKIMIRETEHKHNLKVIITSRYGYIDVGLLKKTHSLILQLDEFDTSQQQSWLSKFIVFHSETNLTSEKIHVYNHDENYKPIKELITQPILLHLIATLNQEVTTEMNRAMVYDRLFTELINRSWAKEGQIDSLVGIEKEDLRDFLRNIAYAIYISGREYIHKSTLTTLPETKEFIKKINTKDAMKDVLKNIMIAFYFQETKKDKADDTEDDRNDYAIEFLHKSLQEYLVAEKLWEEIQAFIDKDNRKGKYLIDSPKVGLDLLNKLFSEDSLPYEVYKSLQEIIKNSSAFVRENILERFKLFMPTWFAYGFVTEYNWHHNDFLEMESNLIFNFFSFLSNLTEEQVIIQNSESSIFSGKRLQMPIRNYIMNGSLPENGCKESLNNHNRVDIYNSMFHIIEYGGNPMGYFDMKSMVISSVKFFQIDVNLSGRFFNSIFNDVTFTLANHSKNFKYSFNECHFTESTFVEGYFDFNNCVFSNCIFRKRTLSSFSQSIINECVFFLENEDNEKERYLRELISDTCVIIKVSTIKDSEENQNPLINEELPL